MSGMETVSPLRKGKPVARRGRKANGPHEGSRAVEQGELAPNTRVLACGSCLDPAVACAALQAGARGFIHAGMTPEQTARAIEVVMDGRLAAPRQLLGYLVKREEERKVKSNLHTLSKRQRETLALVAEGLTNSQIANRLFVSESTVKQRLGNIYKILDISSRTDAVKLLYNAEQVSSETL